MNDERPKPKTAEEKRARKTAWQREKRRANPEWANAQSKKWRDEHPEKRRESRAKNYQEHAAERREYTRAGHAATQAASVQTAGRRGEVWTSAEDRLVMDRSLTLREIAIKVSRTFHATRRRREILLKGERERAASVAAAHGSIEGE